MDNDGWDDRARVAAGADQFIAALPNDERGPVYDYAFAHSLLCTIFAEGVR